MRNGVFLAEQVAAEDMRIGGEAVAFVHGEEPLPPGAVKRREAVPGDAGMGVVHGMEVVVQEQERQRAAILDDDRASASA